MDVTKADVAIATRAASRSTTTASAARTAAFSTAPATRSPAGLATSAPNSGGTATYGKLAAARALGLAVILLRRPTLPEAPTVDTVEDAVTWLDHARALPIERGV